MNTVYLQHFSRLDVCVNALKLLLNSASTTHTWYIAGQIAPNNLINLFVPICQYVDSLPKDAALLEYQREKLVLTLNFPKFTIIATLSDKFFCTLEVLAAHPHDITKLIDVYQTVYFNGKIQASNTEEKTDDSDLKDLFH